MSGITFKLDKKFTKQAKGVIEKYYFDVGVLNDGPHYKASGDMSTYAGGPVRSSSSKSSGMKVSDVSESARIQTGINFYTRPFLNPSKKSADLLNFVKAYFQLIGGKTQKKRVENLLQAVVRNPILRGDYGSNTKKTQKIKGFNRLLIDTGQLFKHITAKVRIKNNVS